MSVNIEQYAGKKMTRAEFEHLPHGIPCQLINGELVVSPSPTYFHQSIAVEIEYIFKQFIQQLGKGKVLLAPLDIFFGDNEAFQPDVMVFLEKPDVVKGKVVSIPDLIVEILSPSTGYFDLTHKKVVYERAGVQEYWIIDPEELTVEVYSQSAKGFVMTDRASRVGVVESRLLLGCSVSLSGIFQE